MTTPLFVATWDFGELAVREAWAHWEKTKDLAESCITGTAAVESDPTVPTVGIGGLPNRDGRVELDAGYMRGKDLSCGSVAALRVHCPAIRVAKAVADQTNHVMMAGQGADDFALQQGFECFKPEALLTEQTRVEFETWRSKVERGEIDGARMVGHDTVGVLGWHEGHTVSCVATSGLGFKRAGRVGDSPIIGAGLYADDAAGCAASTGIGEELYRHVVSVRVCDAMRSGATANQAAASALQRMIDYDRVNATRGLSIIAIDRHGAVGAATTRNANHQFEYHVCQAGVFKRVVPGPIGL